MAVDYARVGARKYCTQYMDQACSRYRDELLYAVLFTALQSACNLQIPGRVRRPTPAGSPDRLRFLRQPVSSNPLDKLQVQRGENWPGTILKRDWISMRPRYWLHIGIMDSPHLHPTGLSEVVESLLVAFASPMPLKHRAEARTPSSPELILSRFIARCLTLPGSAIRL